VDTELGIRFSSSWAGFDILTEFVQAASIIKTGPPFRSGRIANYSQLLDIEAQLGGRAPLRRG